MNNFFHKKRLKTEATDASSTQPEADFGDTSTIDVAEVSARLKKNRFSSQAKGYASSVWLFARNHRIASICICVVLVAAIISLGAFGFIALKNPLYGYAQAAASKSSIMRTMPISGTLESGDKYEITSLVSGKVISSAFDVGDKVTKNDVLYQLDDTEAKLAAERAKNEVDMASDSTSAAPTTYRIISSEAGTVQSLSIKAGSTVSPGSQVGTLLRDDGSVTAITSYVSGTVSVLSVRAGQSLSAGQIIASVNSSSSEAEKNRPYYKRSAEIELQAAQRQLEHYSIKSPVTGVVVEKKTKNGDNVNATDHENPMMVILDTSNLKFTFSVDEETVCNLEKGQVVSVKSESAPDANFKGEILTVSREGILSEDNKLMFDVTVIVNEPEDLRAGMKVSGSVLLDSVQNVLSVPTKSLMESDGTQALVFVKSDESDTAADIEKSNTLALEYPHIKVPAGCRLVSVRYGLSDGTFVHIKSGLKLGDIVVYKPRNSHILVENPDDDKKESSAPSKVITPPSEEKVSLPTDNTQTPDEENIPEIPDTTEAITGEA